ncbi:MAG: HTH-type transcriptional repressor NsrR [Phycisphaerae bacterium]|nr:HTH-type transcriptional repressor NsrR [Phycisphaerae bacterium]
MLSLTRRTEYGLIALAYLSRNQDKICSAREIAETHHVPLPLLMNIMKSFQQNNMITSTRGAKGGYQLNQAPRDITVERVIQVLEGPMRLVQCANQTNGDGAINNRCEIDGRCLLRSPLLKLHQQVSDFMAGVTLADLIDGQLQAANNTTGCYEQANLS